MPLTPARGDRRAAAYDRSRTQWLSLEPGVQGRSAFWFKVNHNGGSVILHHRHIRPVLIREWSPPMDGITATIWASRTIRVGHQSDSE